MIYIVDEDGHFFGDDLPDDIAVQAEVSVGYNLVSRDMDEVFFDGRTGQWLQCF